MATLKDVAKEAGLTVTTVSRVLNNRGYISEDARNRVSEAMKKLNYRPNEVARSLHNKKTNTIGLIVPHIRHPYFAEMISNIENEAYKKGYKILLCNSQSTKERVSEYIDICTSNRVAGIILCSGVVSVSTFEDLDVPVITMERYVDDGTASVECDNEAGGRIAAQTLIDAGCKKLLFIGGPVGSHMPADKRRDGFKSVCDETGVEIVEVETESLSYVDITYSEFLEKVFIEHPDIDGLFASSDVIAAQALQVCRKIGITVPDQLKIVGFDDVIIATVTTPQLTTIHQPVKEMARKAVELLHDAANGKEVEKQVVLPVSLVKRETV